MASLGYFRRDGVPSQPSRSSPPKESGRRRHEDPDDDAARHRHNQSRGRQYPPDFSQPSGEPVNRQFTASPDSFQSHHGPREDDRGDRHRFSGPPRRSTGDGIFPSRPEERTGYGHRSADEKRSHRTFESDYSGSTKQRRKSDPHHQDTSEKERPGRYRNSRQYPPESRRQPPRSSTAQTHQESHRRGRDDASAPPASYEADKDPYRNNPSSSNPPSQWTKSTKYHYPAPPGQASKSGDLPPDRRNSDSRNNWGYTPHGPTKATQDEGFSYTAQKNGGRAGRSGNTDTRQTDDRGGTDEKQDGPSHGRTQQERRGHGFPSTGSSEADSFMAQLLRQIKLEGASALKDYLPKSNSMPASFPALLPSEDAEYIQDTLHGTVEFSGLFRRSDAQGPLVMVTELDINTKRLSGAYGRNDTITRNGSGYETNTLVNGKIHDRETDMNYILEYDRWMEWKLGGAYSGEEHSVVSVGKKGDAPVKTERTYPFSGLLEGKGAKSG